VQAFVVVSHRDADAFVQSVFARHETHVVVDVLQTGFVESLQSVLARQLTHEFFDTSQTDLEVSLQSVLPKHATQTFFAVSQAGFDESLQSPLVKHATHLSVASSQTGVLPEHASLHGAFELELVPPLVVPPSFDEPPPLAPPSELLDVPPSGAQLRFQLQSSARLLQPQCNNAAR
jgi:hypothetical protein